jgi:phage I-like protein
VLFFNARDTKTGKSIGTLLGPPALTNFPLIQGMEPLTAKKIDLNKKENKPMGEFLKKLFAALGIEAADDVGEDKAIELIKAKAAPPEPPPRPKVAVPVAILKALDLSEEATEDESVGVIMALKFPSDRIPVERYRDLEEQLHERDLLDLIDKACRPGDSDMECKLYPHERDWALAEARKNFPAMQTFIKHRPKVLALMAKLPTGKKDELRIDDLQADINRQVGVSREVFLKYNH